MRTADRRATLHDSLAELSSLADGAYSGQLSEIAERLEHGRLRILVAGEAKRGKSTVANALLGRDVLPSGVIPLTAITTTVMHGTDEHVRAEFAGGRTERRPLADLDVLVTERGNPGNRLGVARVTVYLEAPLLARGVELVDTPGTGSVYEHNTEEAERALESLDTAIVVLTADPPPSAAERELLGRVARRSVQTFVLLNKVDRLDEAERKEALAFTAEVVRQAAGEDIPVLPVSARAALTGASGDGQDRAGDEGFAAFTAAFTDYLDAKRAGDVERSVAGHARRVAEALLDEVRLARRASELRAGEAAGRVREFRDRLAAVQTRRRDATDLAEGEGRRLLSGLNDAADQETRRLTATVRDGLAAVLNGDLAIAPPGEIEERGREWLGRHARDGADRWRDAQRRSLEASLGELDERLLGALHGELARVRDAARELLDLELTVPDTGGRLVDNRRFFYAGTPSSGQTELLAGAVRRRIPGELGRRRAREHLLREAADRIPQLIGRARSDLQYRLEESTRRLVRAIDQRYADSIGRLMAALDMAVADSGRTDDEERAREHDLTERERMLTVLLERLGERSS